MPVAACSATSLYPRSTRSGPKDANSNKMTRNISRCARYIKRLVACARDSKATLCVAASMATRGTKRGTFGEETVLSSVDEDARRKNTSLSPRTFPHRATSPPSSHIAFALPGRDTGCALLIIQSDVLEGRTRCGDTSHSSNVVQKLVRNRETGLVVKKGKSP